MRGRHKNMNKMKWRYKWGTRTKHHNLPWLRSTISYKTVTTSTLKNVKPRVILTIKWESFVWRLRIEDKQISETRVNSYAVVTLNDFSLLKHVVLVLVLIKLQNYRRLSYARLFLLGTESKKKYERAFTDPLNMKVLPFMTVTENSNNSRGVTW